MDCELSEEFEVKEWIVSCQKSLRSKSTISAVTFIYGVVVDVITEMSRVGVLSELLYADDLVLMSETIEGLRDKFLKWKEAFERKGLKANLGKTNVMVSGGITKDGLSKSKVDSCGVCSLRVKPKSVLCVQSGKWIHGRCAGVKMVTPKFSSSLTCRKCEGNIGEAVDQEGKLCDEVETVREFTYFGDRVSAGGGCEAAVTARTRSWLVTLREWGELLYGRRFPLWVKEAVYRSYVRPVILYGSEA